MQRIRHIHAESRRTYGSPRVYAELRDRGEHTSRKRIARLMKHVGLVGRQRRRFVHTTDSRHGFRVAPNVLARQFSPTAPDQVWASDITYIPTRAGWLFLAAVLDLFSRRVVGWSMHAYLDRRLVLNALHMALADRQPPAGLLHHSDQGVQYACDDYQLALASAAAIPSMSRTGNCWDNAVVESFFATLKLELVYQSDCADHAEARTAIFEYIEGFYNRKRKHSTLGYCSPVEYEREQP